MTARLLFAAKRDRPDIQVVVVYLCTRVREPTESGCLQLTRVIRYLRDTVHLPFTRYLIVKSRVNYLPKSVRISLTLLLLIPRTKKCGGTPVPYSFPTLTNEE